MPDRLNDPTVARTPNLFCPACQEYRQHTLAEWRAYHPGAGSTGRPAIVDAPKMGVYDESNRCIRCGRNRNQLHGSDCELNPRI